MNQLESIVAYLRNYPFYMHLKKKLYVFFTSIDLSHYSYFFIQNN